MNRAATAPLRTSAGQHADSLKPPISPEAMAAVTARMVAGNQLINRVRQEMALAVVGQSRLIDNLLIGLLTDGHVLVEGVPGLAKTTIIKHLAQCIDAQFHRIQFTPDLLPADVIGTLIYNPKTAEFVTRRGPVFTNILLADEINRCPPKVQSALLEAMQEHQVTLGDQTYMLPSPFLVMATENPIEQEGTYPLPEAQIDRFMIKAYVDYPSDQEEYDILTYIADEKAKPVLNPVLTLQDVERLRQLVKEVYMAEQLKRYIVNLVVATRNIGEIAPKLAGLVRYGSSPRATIFLTRASRAMAFLAGRAYVTPEDIKTVAPSIMGHRILTTYEADAEEVTSYGIARQLLELVPVP